MGKQKDRPQMKEQEKTPQKELNEIEASDLSAIELSNDYNDAQQHKKGHRNDKKGPVTNE